MEAPLVNEYKQPFIWRRLLQTFLGGLRLSMPLSPPLYVYVLQVSLFMGLICSITAFLVLCECGVLPLSAAVVGCGGWLLMYCLTLHATSHIIQKQEPKPGQHDQGRAALDEDAVLVDGWLGPYTWQLLVPGRHSVPASVVHAAVAGLTAAAAVYSLRPGELQLLLEAPPSLSLLLCVLGVWSTSVGVYGLITIPPAEPALFRPLLPYHLAALSRPAHLLTAALLHILHSYYPDVWLTTTLNWFGHVTVSSAWLLWTLGALPPLDAYVLWLLEQWHVVALGGSPCASNSRLCWQVAAGSVSLALLVVLPTFPQLLAAAAVRGALLAVDYVWMVSCAVAAHDPQAGVFSPVLAHKRHEDKKRITSSTLNAGSYSRLRSDTRSSSSNSSSVKAAARLNRVTALREALLSVLLLLFVIVASLALYGIHQRWYVARHRGTHENATMTGGNETFSTTGWDELPHVLYQGDQPGVPLIFRSAALTGAGMSWVMLGAACMAVSVLQQVWVVGAVRNLMWRDSAKEAGPVEAGVFYCVAQALAWGAPLACTVGLQMWIAADSALLYRTHHPGTAYWLLRALPLARAFRAVWTFPQQSCLHLSTFFVLEVACGKLQQVVSFSLLSWYMEVSASARFMILCVAWLWGRRALHHMTAVCLMAYTSVADEKQRRPITLMLVSLNIALMPAVWLLVGSAAVLDAPLLPLFTLPLFLLGFPRPTRFWPYPVGHSANTCEDTVYYEQVTPHVLSSVHSHVQAGALGMVASGDHFLVRFEDRFIWIQILETGLYFQYYSVKGLELQETSCHSVEASRVDALFSRAFDACQPRRSCSNRLLNTNYVHTLTAVTRIPVLAYCDTKNVLTGVIDSNDFLAVMPEYFTKALLFVIMDFIIAKKLNDGSAPMNDSENPTIARSTHRRGSSTHSLRSATSPLVLPPLPVLSRNAETSFQDCPSPTALQQQSPRPSVVPLPRPPSVEDSKDGRSIQSGRGSRLAWVDRTRLNTISDSPTPDWEEDLAMGMVLDEDKLGLQLSRRPFTNKRENIHSAYSSDFPHSKTQNYVNSPRNVSPASHQAMLPDLSMRNMPGFLYEGSQAKERIDFELDSNSPLPICSHRRDTLVTKVNLRALSRSETHDTQYFTRNAAYAPPSIWLRELPFTPDTLDDFQVFFPVSWYKFLLSYLVRERLKSEKEKEALLIQQTNDKDGKSKKKKTKISGKNSKVKRGSSISKKPLSSAQHKYGSEFPVGSTETAAITTTTTTSLGGATDLQPHHHTHKTSLASDNKILLNLLEDDILEEAYRAVTACCHMVLSGQGDDIPTPAEVNNIFTSARLASSTQLDWLKSHHRLHALAVRAYRMAVKVSLDHVLIGLNSSSWPDLLEALSEYNTRWFFGPDEAKLAPGTTANGNSNRSNTNSRGGALATEASADVPVTVTSPPRVQQRVSGLAWLCGLARGGSGNRVTSDDHSTDEQEEEWQEEPRDWQEAVKREVPNLFSIGYNDVKGVYTSHLATLQVEGAGVGRLAGAVVTALWAALGPELLYFTNDDDERYSIQAHGSILRNLTIQAADPPLGYPIYSSPPVRLGPPWVSAMLPILQRRQASMRRMDLPPDE